MQTPTGATGWTTPASAFGVGALEDAVGETAVARGTLAVGGTIVVVAGAGKGSATRVPGGWGCVSMPLAPKPSGSPLKGATGMDTGTVMVPKPEEPVKGPPNGVAAENSGACALGPERTKLPGNKGAGCGMEARMAAAAAAAAVATAAAAVGGAKGADNGAADPTPPRKGMPKGP